MSTTRCYAICRRCSSVYPDGRRCPGCDGDVEAARAVAAATVVAVEATRMPNTRPLRSSALMVTGLVALSLFAGLGMLVLALL